MKTGVPLTIWLTRQAMKFASLPNPTLSNQSSNLIQNLSNYLESLLLKLDEHNYPIIKKELCDHSRYEVLSKLSYLIPLICKYFI